MNTILVGASYFQASFETAPAGTIHFVFLHGCGWPPERRRNPPRLRLTDEWVKGLRRCEILDPWPGAPTHWPPHLAPGSALPSWDLSQGTDQRAPIPADPARAGSGR